MNNKDNKIFSFKYLPISFDDYLDIPEIIKLLKNRIQYDFNNIILIGDSCTGKTSLIKSIVYEYYKGSEQKYVHENILHINNLKDQGINFYRNDIKIFCQTQTTIPKKKKLIIIDDIDYLTHHNQQLLKNTIDKHKNNVCMCASSTSSQKIIEHMQSRALLIKLERLTRNSQQKIISKISKTEKIDIDPSLYDSIISKSNGNIKVVINMLEKFKLINKPIDEVIINELFNNMNNYALYEFNSNLLNNNIVDALKILMNFNNNGYSVIDILNYYYTFVKISDTLDDYQKHEIIPLICKYITIFNNTHEDNIEIIFFINELKFTLDRCKCV
jgi:DNA polymerase III delta prime subunit